MTLMTLLLSIILSSLGTRLNIIIQMGIGAVHAPAIMVHFHLYWVFNYQKKKHYLHNHDCDYDNV